jgi:hypothetical protein
MTMALRDEIKPNINRNVLFQRWIAEQPNAEEWFDVIDDITFSNNAVADLLEKYGFKCDGNFVHRLRRVRAKS